MEVFIIEKYVISKLWSVSLSDLMLAEDYWIECFLSIISPFIELKVTLSADIYNITLTILKYSILKWITDMLSVSGSSMTKSSPGKYEQRWWVQPPPEAPLIFSPMCFNTAVPMTQLQHIMMAKQLDERNMNPWLISWCKASCLSRLTRLLYVVREISFYLSYCILGWLFFFFFFLLHWVFVATQGLSLVAASGVPLSSCDLQPSHCGGFSYCEAQAVGCMGFSSRSTWAQLPHGICGLLCSFSTSGNVALAYFPMVGCLCMIFMERWFYK